jgi:integrase
VASIERKRKGGYAVRWRDPDGRQRQRTTSTYKAAERLKREIQESCEVGHRWKPRDACRPADVSEVMEAYVRAIALRGLGSRTIRTYALKLQEFKVWIGRKVRNPGMDLLSMPRLREYHEHLLNSGRKGFRSPDTARKHLEAILLWWQWAEDESADHEWTGIPRPPRKLRIARSPKAVPTAPTWAQMDACIESCRVPWHRHLATLLRFTGIRTGAALLVKWEDIDLQQATITLRPEITKGGYGGRRLPLSPHLVAEMAGWGVREGFVISAPERERQAVRGDLHPVTGASIRGKVQSYLNGAWQRAGVPEVVWKRAPGKAFRRGFTSRLKTAGADTESVEYLVGHKIESVRASYLDTSAMDALMAAAVRKVPGIGGSPDAPRLQSRA